MCDAPQGHVQVKRPEMEYSYDDKIRPAQKAEMESGVGKIEIRFGTGTKKVKAEGKEELIPHIPVISHEIGQYETYPDYREIEKYTGVLVPENLKIFKERLEQAGMVHMAQKFFQASGKLVVQCYIVLSLFTNPHKGKNKGKKIWQQFITNYKNGGWDWMKCL